MLTSTMMDEPLLISSIIRHAVRTFPDRPIVSVSGDGTVVRTDYRAAYRRICQLAHALVALGVRPGDAVATLAWNDHRHFELYYAISGIGAVCHTLNPRLADDQLTYIVNHAGDRLVFADPMFLETLARVAGRLPSVEAVVSLSGDQPRQEIEGKTKSAYEALIADRETEFDWPNLPDTHPASACYTSGTTGEPKGVVYSHRSTILHALVTAMPDALGLSCRDAVLPIVPMFHVNAWGLPYSAPICGAKLVLPGPHLDGRSVAELIRAEDVTFSAGVPTVWNGLLQHLDATGEDLGPLKRLVCGGAAPPSSMIAAFEQRHGIDFIHGWGMTETSPIASISMTKPGMEDWPHDPRLTKKAKQGVPLFGVETRIADEDGATLAQDGQAAGHLMVRGPWIAGTYVGSDAMETLVDGWFPTGDVATIDTDGFIEITDRLKDVIKSGGEWISSIALENATAGSDEVAQAAVIAVPDRKWGERPLLVVVPAPDRSPSQDSIRRHLEGMVPKWWLPDQVVFADALPIGPTGKVLKRELRDRFVFELVD